MKNETKLTAEQIEAAVRRLAGTMLAGIVPMVEALIKEAEECERCNHDNPKDKCAADCPLLPIRKVLNEVRAEAPKERSASEVLTELEGLAFRGSAIAALTKEAQAAVKRLEAERDILQRDKAAILFAVNAKTVEDPDCDWTVDPATGRVNSSERFNRLEKEIGQMIRDSAHTLLGGGGTDCVAGMILARLAHRHGFTPKKGA